MLRAGLCETAAQQAEAMRVALTSRCPSDAWQIALSLRLESAAMTIVSVGANKGYGVLSLLINFAASNVTPTAWQRELQRLAPECGRCCGICNDCFSAGRRHDVKRVAAQVHAFEVMPANVAMLRAAAAYFQLPIAVHEVAVSNASGSLALPDWALRRLSRPGYENAMLDFAPHRGARRRRPVPATTIDAFVAERALQVIHVLEADANGMDALVLEGAAKTLAARRVEILTFEYHSTGFWAACAECRSLRDVLARLLGFGYGCFWQGKGGVLARASGHSCWQDAFEFRQWSNLICTYRPDLLALLDQMPMKLG